MATIQRLRIWTEGVLCLMSVGLALATLLEPTWIEATFGIDPDGGSGAVEWALVVGLAALGVAFGALARRDRQRYLSAPECS